MRWAFKMYDEDNSREIDIHEMERVMLVSEMTSQRVHETFESVNLTQLLDLRIEYLNRPDALKVCIDRIPDLELGPMIKEDLGVNLTLSSCLISKDIFSPFTQC